MDRESGEFELDGSSGAADEAGDTPVVASASGKRQGRNFVAGAGVGVLFGVVVLLILYFAKPLFLALVVAFGGVGLWEISHALRGKEIDTPLVPLVAVLAAEVLSAYFFGLAGVAVTTVAGVLLLFAWQLRGGVDNYVRDATASVCVAVYVPVLLAFVGLLLRPDDGAERIIVFIAAVFASDIGGLTLGSLIGRHAMAPVISPKKSWEGMIGSVVFSAAIGGWLVWWLLDGSWWQGALVGVAAAVVGTIGDFVESAIKRDVGVKDMSSFVPGHGGMMDRLDSLAAAAPAVWALLTVFTPPGS